MLGILESSLCGAGKEAGVFYMNNNRNLKSWAFKITPGDRA